MKLQLKKFGDLLTSRQDGKEALAAIESQLQNLSEDAKIELDFDGVITFTPSWADEFVTKLIERFGDRVILLHTENPSVVTTLDILKKFG